MGCRTRKQLGIKCSTNAHNARQTHKAYLNKILWGVPQRDVRIEELETVFLEQKVRDFRATLQGVPFRGHWRKQVGLRVADRDADVRHPKSTIIQDFALTYCRDVCV